MKRALTIAAVGMLVAGCGGGTPNNPRSVAQAFAGAMAKQDGAKACSLMSTAAQAEVISAGVVVGLQNASCKQSFKAVVKLMSAEQRAKLKRSRVRSVSVKGNTALVHYSTDGPADTPTALVKQDGRWRIDKKPAAVNTATYTCAQFEKSLHTKGDESAANFVTELVAQARLGQSVLDARRELTLGIAYACRGRSGSTTPAATAVTVARQIRDGQFKPGK